MKDLYVVIANFGRGQQSLWPRMRDSRSEGAPIFGDADPSTSSGVTGLFTKAEADAIVSDNSERGYGAPHYHAKSLAVAHEFAQGLAGNLIRRAQQDILNESRMIKLKKSHLAKIIREAQWGAFEHGAAPLDEPPLDSGPMSPEMQQRVFDMLVDSGSDPKKLKASGDYPDVDRMMEESVDEKTYDDLVAMLDDVASPGWIKWNLEDGLTKDEIIARAKEGEERSKAHMRGEGEYARPDYEGGEDRGLAAREYTVGHADPNPPSAFPIRVGWDGGSYDAVDDEDLEMITRDLVSKGIAYSVDSVSELEPEVSVGAGIEQYAEGAGKIRIKKSNLKKLIREALMQEAHQAIITNSYEDVEIYNILANYALANDIQGALADPEIKPYVEKNEVGWISDEAGGWFEQVGEATDLPAPEGWDKNKAYQFLRDLEDAAWKVYNKQATAAIAGDPDREFLEFLGNQWTSMIEPNDMEGIKWKEYKRYIRLKPPPSISHGVGEIHITREDTENLYPGAWEDFKDFLTTRAGGQLGRRAPTRRSPPPVYD